MQADFHVVEWAKDSNIYEVNLRQYTREGSFLAFSKHLPRLRDMGVETLWFMPVTPISKLKRLGSLGSYYACSDYNSVNPEFGSLSDFQWLVAEAHQMGFKVLIDWVANHTGWDHTWTTEHPEFYRKNIEGQFYDANGWEDVIDLNYDYAELWEQMILAMRFWVEACDIDGFRCDMAMLVPLEFWKKCRQELDQIKPLFWLAECEETDYHKVFDASYAWKWLHAMETYWKDSGNVPGLVHVLEYYVQQFPPKAIRAFFTSNHDENSHSGSEYERLGDAARPFAVFCCLYDGLPLIYSGQELPNLKRLLFFDKDEIDWSQACRLHEFYKTLLGLRKKYAPLQCGKPETRAKFLSTTASEKVLGFLRRYQDEEVMVVLNLSSETQSVIITDKALSGSYQDACNNREPDFISGQPLLLLPWDYRVYVK